MKKVRVLVVGVGNMGLSHARAYAANKGFEIAGLCSRGIDQRADIKAEFPGVALFNDYAEALAATSPDAVSINTWPDTHGEYAKMALNAGCHLFIEKPLAATVEEARGHRGAGARQEAEGGDRLHSPRPSLVDEVRGGGPHARQAAGDAHEPQPAIPPARSGRCTSN